MKTIIVLVNHCFSKIHPAGQKISRQNNLHQLKLDKMCLSRHCFGFQGRHLSPLVAITYRLVVAQPIRMHQFDNNHWLDFAYNNNYNSVHHFLYREMCITIQNIVSFSQASAVCSHSHCSGFHFVHTLNLSRDIIGLIQIFSNSCTKAVAGTFLK